MLRVDLKRLGENRKAALEYLRSRLDQPPKVKGDQVELAGTRAKEAKTLLHKFLHHEGLENYHVSVINSELIEVHPVEIRKKRIQGKEGATPASWETVPSQSWLRPPGFSRPGKKSKKRI